MSIIRWIRSAMADALEIDVGQPHNIAISQYVQHPATGQGIEQVLRQHRINGECIKESHFDDKAIYDFRVAIGTKVSAVSQIAAEELPRHFGSSFRATRAGSIIQIFEQKESRTNNLLGQ